MEITQKNKLTILTPATGFTLTQSSDLIELKSRIFSKKLYLGIHDDPDNYREISDKEAEILQEELQNLLKQEQNPENIED